MLWIAITVGAATFQVARNALQRGLLGDAGPWGATLARFLFGLPFSLIFVGVAAFLNRPAHLTFGARFLISCAVGGATQVVATAAMLVSMRRSSFALGTVFQQSAIPLAALMGLLFGERLHAPTWIGIGLATAGLTMLGWPRAVAGRRDGTAVLLGLVAGAGFAMSSNAFRQAALSLHAANPVFAALATVFVVQALQSTALVVWLAIDDRRALAAVINRWRSSLPAGFFGAAASGLWFTAFALSPVGPVRAVGVMELPLAALAGRRLFAERVAVWQLAVAGVIAVGVCLAALG